MSRGFDYDAWLANQSEPVSICQHKRRADDCPRCNEDGDVQNDRERDERYEEKN